MSFDCSRDVNAGGITFPFFQKNSTFSNNQNDKVKKYVALCFTGLSHPAKEINISMERMF